MLSDCRGHDLGFIGFAQPQGGTDSRNEYGRRRREPQRPTMEHGGMQLGSRRRGKSLATVLRLGEPVQGLPDFRQFIHRAAMARILPQPRLVPFRVRGRGGSGFHPPDPRSRLFVDFGARA